MRLWCFAAAASGMLLSGCEGCDFSFGPIPVYFTISLIDEDGNLRSAEATPLAGALEVCRENDGAPFCQTVPFSTANRWTWSGSTGWEGYATCRVPDLWFTASAEDCTVEEVVVPGGKQADIPVDAGIVLRCAG